VASWLLRRPRQQEHGASGARGRTEAPLECGGQNRSTEALADAHHAIPALTRAAPPLHPVSGMPTQANHDRDDLRRPQEAAPEFQESKRALGSWTLVAILGLIGVLAWFLLRGGS
jgi:hypothetical protein